MEEKSSPLKQKKFPNLGNPREEEMQEIIEELYSLWEQHPQQRLGQLLENYVFVKGHRGDKTSCAIFYQGDDETLKRIKDEKKQQSS